MMVLWDMMVVATGPAQRQRSVRHCVTCHSCLTELQVMAHTCSLSWCEQLIPVLHDGH